MPGGTHILINDRRQAWGLSPVSHTGVVDPLGLVHEAEQGGRLAFAGEATKMTGVALKLLGKLTGNKVLRVLGIVLSKVGKRIMEDAAEDIAALSAPIQDAYVQALAEWFAFNHQAAGRTNPARQPIIAVMQDGQKYNLPNGITIEPDPLHKGPIQADSALWWAHFCPVTDHPAFRQTLGRELFDRMKRRSDIFRYSLSSEIAMGQLRPFENELSATQQRRSDQLRAIASLHEPAMAVLMEDPVFRERFEAARRRGHESRVAAAVALGQKLAEEPPPPPPAPPWLASSVVSPSQAGR